MMALEPVMNNLALSFKSAQKCIEMHRNGDSEEGKYSK